MKVNRLTVFYDWFLISMVNFNGHVGIHSIRHPIYRHVFRIGLPKDSIIYTGCRFLGPSGVKIGNHSVIQDHAFLDGRRGLTIGNNVHICMEVRIFTAEHDPNSTTFATTGGPVIIKDWAYIGPRVTILPEVIIEEGAVVAAGAVVTKNVEPWTMVGGVPAKFIKDRPKAEYILDTNYKALFQ